MIFLAQRSLFVFLCSLNIYCFGQGCDEDFFAVRLHGEYGQSYNSSAINNKNEIILVGSQLQQANFKNDAIVTKLTPQGSVLWSKKFQAAGYRSFEFNDVAAMPDGSFMITGWASNVDTSTSYLKRSWGIIIKIDGYGNLVWTRSFSNYNELDHFTTIRNIAYINDNDCIVFGNLYGRAGNFLTRGPQVIMRIDGNGSIKWRTTISSEMGFVSGTEKFGYKLLNNSELVLGLKVAQNEFSGYGYGQFLQEGYLVTKIDYATGDMRWNKVYTFPITVSLSGVGWDGIKHIASLPNGDLSFSFSFSETDNYSSAPNTKRAGIFVTDNSGNLKQVTSYINSVPGCRIYGCIDDGSGSQVVLMYDGRQPILAKIDASNEIIWQRGFGNIGAQYVPIGVYRSGPGYDLLLQNPYQPDIIMIKSAADGKMDCLNTPVNLIKENVTSLFQLKATDLIFRTSEEVLLPIYLVNKTFAVETNELCSQTCCTDILDTANTSNITLCEGDTYILPNNYIVKDSGTYYISNKTPNGCDSVSFYHFTVVKDPSTLDIKGDFCMEGADSLKLNATGGFDSYTWMNTTIPDSFYTVRAPGIYKVSVSNICGSKTAEKEVFSKCEFEIYMPTAFTPNGDGLNDLFRVPKQNKNSLVKLVIYNRWGQKVFETTEVDNGWDGNYKGIKQPVGSYVYLLRMKTISGRPIDSKGVFTLIR